MYFSTLPLLLLFASAVCALPVEAGARPDIFDLPRHMQGNPLYFKCSDAFKELEHTESYKGWHDLQKIDGVQGASEMKTISGDQIAVRVEVPHATIPRVNEMIKYAEGTKTMQGWGWSLLVSSNVAFIFEMIPGGEETIKEYLGKD